MSAQTVDARPLLHDDAALLLALLADPLACYRASTPALERALALTPGAMHGRRAPDPVLAALEAARAAICAVLATRRRLDVTQQGVHTSVRTSAGVPGGTRVPVNPPRPGPLPPVRLPEPEGAL